MVNIPLFTWFYTSKRWLFRISEPSTVCLGIHLPGWVLKEQDDDVSTNHVSKMPQIDAFQLTQPVDPEIKV